MGTVVGTVVLGTVVAAIVVVDDSVVGSVVADDSVVGTVVVDDSVVGTVVAGTVISDSNISFAVVLTIAGSVVSSSKFPWLNNGKSNKNIRIIISIASTRTATDKYLILFFVF